MVRYRYFGNKIPQVGKTLWEIVGNLKNFGVGRLIIRSDTLQYPEPSFFKILQVQPLEEPEIKVYNRNVIAWVEEVYRGKKLEGVKEMTENHLPNFMLIPKSEEKKYYELEEKYKTIETKELIAPYIKLPPLLKLFCEKKYYSGRSNFTRINTVLDDDEYKNRKMQEGNSEMPKQHCDLYLDKVPVEEHIKEIVRLQKIVNSYK